MPLLAISPRFFRPVFSRYHNAVLEFDAAARCLIPYQHLTFIPLLMVAKFGETATHMAMLAHKCPHIVNANTPFKACS